MNNVPSDIIVELAKTRELYDKEILRILQNGNEKRKLYEWRTRAWIQKKIKDIEEGKVWQKYRVEERSGAKVLIIARGVRAREMQVIPIEDYFEVIYAANILTGHGALHEIRHYLETRKLYMPYIAVGCFLKLRGSYKTQKSPYFSRFRLYHGFLELIDMSDSPDGDYNFMMFFKALKLRRKFLRPLYSNDAVEIAEQLLELFSLVGPPRALHTPTKAFTKAIILRLAIVLPGCKIICGRNRQLPAKSKELKSNIRKWMAYKNTSEWSKGVNEYYLTASDFKLRREQQMEIEHAINLLDVNVPGTSSMQQDLDHLKKEAHQSYLKKNIVSGEEVLRLLKPYKTYGKSLLQTPAPPQGPSTPSTEKKSPKTYTRAKKEKSQITIPSINNKEEPAEKRVLCINTNIREICNLSKGRKKKRMYDIWNTTLDLPDQSVPEVNNISINISSNLHFGMIPQECVGLLNDDHNDEVRKRHLSSETSNEEFKNKSIKLEEPDLEQQTQISTPESMELKKEMPPCVFSDFSEVKPCLDDLTHFSNLENKHIKEEMCFETPTIFNALENNGIKKEEEEEAQFCEILKIESLVD